MEIVPLQAVPNQAVLTSLNGQQTQLNVYQKRTGLFMDIFVGNSLVLSGVRCRKPDADGHGRLFRLRR